MHGDKGSQRVENAGVGVESHIKADQAKLQWWITPHLCGLIRCFLPSHVMAWCGSDGSFVSREADPCCHHVSLPSRSPLFPVSWVRKGEWVEVWIECFRSQSCAGCLVRVQARDGSCKETRSLPVCWARSNWLGELWASLGHKRERKKKGDSPTLQVSWKTGMVHVPSWPGVLVRGQDGEGVSSQWLLIIPPDNTQRGRGGVGHKSTLEGSLYR